MGCDSRGASAFASVDKSRKPLYPADINRYGGCGNRVLICESPRSLPLSRARSCASLATPDGVPCPLEVNAAPHTSAPRLPPRYGPFRMVGDKFCAPLRRRKFPFLPRRIPAPSTLLPAVCRNPFILTVFPALVPYICLPDASRLACNLRLLVSQLPA